MLSPDTSTISTPTCPSELFFDDGEDSTTSTDLSTSSSGLTPGAGPSNHYHVTRRSSSTAPQDGRRTAGDLPIDLIRQVLRFLPVRDILRSIALVCRAYCTITLREPFFWRDRCRQHLLSQDGFGGLLYIRQDVYRGSRAPLRSLSLYPSTMHLSPLTDDGRANFSYLVGVPRLILDADASSGNASAAGFPAVPVDVQLCLQRILDDLASHSVHCFTDPPVRLRDGTSLAHEVVCSRWARQIRRAMLFVEGSMPKFNHESTEWKQRGVLDSSKTVRMTVFDAEDHRPRPVDFTEYSDLVAHLKHCLQRCWHLCYTINFTLLLKHKQFVRPIGDGPEPANSLFHVMMTHTNLQRQSDCYPFLVAASGSGTSATEARLYGVGVVFPVATSMANWKSWSAVVARQRGATISDGDHCASSLCVDDDPRAVGLVLGALPAPSSQLPHEDIDRHASASGSPSREDLVHSPTFSLDIPPDHEFQPTSLPDFLLFPLKHILVYVYMLEHITFSDTNHHLWEDPYELKYAICSRIVSPTGDAVECRFFYSHLVRNPRMYVSMSFAETKLPLATIQQVFSGDVERNLQELFKGGYGRVEVDIRPTVSRENFLQLRNTLGLPLNFPVALLWNVVLFATCIGATVLDSHLASTLLQYDMTFTDALELAFSKEELLGIP